MSKGYIYILQNPAFRPDLIKIGMTTRSVGERAKELSSSTSVPSPFEIACLFSVDNCDAIESIVHNRLDSHRWSKNREFFDLSLPTAYKVISEIILEYQGSTIVEQAILDSTSSTLIIDSQSEISSVKTRESELLIKLNELKEKNRVAEERIGEIWAKNCVRIEKKSLPEVNELLSRTDLDEDLRASLFGLKLAMERTLAQKEEVIHKKKDWAKLLKAAEERSQWK